MGWWMRPGGRTIEPGDLRRRRGPMTAPDPRTPPEMSEAEKLACEGEARHDVAARGRIADVAPVQHYLTHTRCEDSRHLPAGTSRRTAPVPRTGGRRAGDVPVGLRGWLRW